MLCIPNDADLRKADEEVTVVGPHEPLWVVSWRPLEDGCQAAAGENALQRQLQHHSVRSARSGRPALCHRHIRAERRLPRLACLADTTLRLLICMINETSPQASRHQYLSKRNGWNCFSLCLPFGLSKHGSHDLKKLLPGRQKVGAHLSFWPKCNWRAKPSFSGTRPT